MGWKGQWSSKLSLRLGTHIDADQGGSDVEAGGICVGHPLGVDGEQTGEALDELLALEGGQAGPLGGQVHAGHIHVRPEDAYLAVQAAVRLHALKELQRCEKPISWDDIRCG